MNDGPRGGVGSARGYACGRARGILRLDTNPLNRSLMAQNFVLKFFFDMVSVGKFRDHIDIYYYYYYFQIPLNLSFFLLNFAMGFLWQQDHITSFFLFKFFIFVTAFATKRPCRIKTVVLWQNTISSFNTVFRHDKL